MRCEHQSNCGFFRYLEERGRLVNGTCGKTLVQECPRWRQASGETLSSQELKVLGVESPYTYDAPITHNETSIAYRRGS